MDIDTYRRAKHLREKIDHVSVKITQVQKMKRRDNDEDFNTCRELALDALNSVKQGFEQDFKEL